MTPDVLRSPVARLYEALKPAYTDPTVWDSFDPTCLTLCSPDPQAIRPPDEKVNVLMVTLPTNFKVAKFDNEKGNAILRQLEKDIDAVRFDPGDGSKIELPVKLRVFRTCSRSSVTRPSRAYRRGKVRGSPRIDLLHVHLNRLAAYLLHGFSHSPVSRWNQVIRRRKVTAAAVFCLQARRHFA